MVFVKNHYQQRALRCENQYYRQIWSRLVNIFKSETNQIIQEKFYFLMDSLVERGIFTKQEH